MSPGSTREVHGRGCIGIPGETQRTLKTKQQDANIGKQPQGRKRLARLGEVVGVE